MAASCCVARNVVSGMGAFGRGGALRWRGVPLRWRGGVLRWRSVGVVLPLRSRSFTLRSRCVALRWLELPLAWCWRALTCVVVDLPCVGVAWL